MALEREKEHRVASPTAIAPHGGIRERWAYLTQPRVTFAVLGECLWAALVRVLDQFDQYVCSNRDIQNESCLGFNFPPGRESL